MSHRSKEVKMSFKVLMKNATVMCMNGRQLLFGMVKALPISYQHGGAPI